MIIRFGAAVCYHRNRAIGKYTFSKQKVRSAQLEKRYFNVDEYYRIARAGVLKPDDRVAL